jgi:pterin-4a-carbinolamine dehydratase
MYNLIVTLEVIILVLVISMVMGSSAVADRESNKQKCNWWSFRNNGAVMTQFHIMNYSNTLQHIKQLSRLAVQ